MMSSNVSSGSGGEISLRSSQENQSSSDTIEKLSEDQIGSVFNTHIDYQYVSTSSRLIQRTEQMESLADCSTTCLNDTKCEVATWVGEKQEVSATGTEDESCTESNPYVRPSTILVPVLSNLCVMHSHFESENLHAAVGYTTIVRKVLGRDSHAAALPSSIDETSQNFNMQRFLDVENLANTSFPSYNHLYFIIGAFIALAVIFVVLIISKFGVRFVWRCLCCGNRCCFVDPDESSDTVGASQAQGTFYTPERLLGEGTYGCVFLVCRSSDKKYCALKYIPCRYPNDIVQAYCELKSLQQVQGHENVIQVLDAFASWPEENQELLSIPNSFFRSAMDIQQIEPLMRNCRIRWNPWSYFCIITDYYPERTMFHLLVRRKNAPLSEQRILEYTTQVCHAVQHLHNCNMIHRDLKPGNLLLTNEGSKIVLTDFGLTRALEAGAYAHTRAGTLHYFAPEQAKHRYTNKADIWAIGCLIYSMATRRVTKATARTMFIDRLQPDFEEVIGAELAREGYSVDLVRLVLKLLEQDPHLRPTAAGALKLIQEAKMRDLLPAPRDSEASKLSDRSSDCTAVSVGDNVKGRESEIKEVDIEATESNACHVEINPSRKRNTTRNEGEEPLLDHCD